MVFMSGLLGRETATIGSAPNNDIVLSGPGVAPTHARLVKQQNQIYFVDLGAGPSFANGQQVPPQQPVPFDFRTQFAVGQVPVPLAHPAIAQMVLAAGQLPAPQRGHIIIGRDPARASLAILHPSVSGAHATVMLDRMIVVDHGSTSGTYVAGQRCPPEQPTPIDPSGVIAFGSVPIPVGLLTSIAQGAAPSPHQGAPAQRPPSMAHAAAPQMGAPPPQGPPPQGAPPPEGGGPRKHRTIIGELAIDQLANSIITIGRTPENQIVVPHPQVSSKHAVIVKQGEQLFLEDKGSANGTFVRGQRLVPNQRVPVANGEKVFIGPMPVVIQIAGSKLNVVVEEGVAFVNQEPITSTR